MTWEPRRQKWGRKRRRLSIPVPCHKKPPRRIAGGFLQLLREKKDCAETPRPTHLNLNATTPGQKNRLSKLELWTPKSRKFAERASNIWRAVRKTMVDGQVNPGCPPKCASVLRGAERLGPFRGGGRAQIHFPWMEFIRCDGAGKEREKLAPAIQRVDLPY